MITASIFSVPVLTAQIDLMTNENIQTNESQQLKFMAERLHYEYINTPSDEKLKFLEQIQIQIEGITNFVEKLKKSVESEEKRLAEEVKRD
ncbi:hypothetical protein [Pseudoalteromonas sp.]|uniref:hypothetical protein n=1 Tax=Pseudoalteromonas sp. TaxID=53249 RepID=UPI00272CE13D|nr:hypothetical protein [Pseudoalteromonas sp.]